MPKDTTCKIDDCTKPSLTRGWCNGHYKRWMRTGDPLPKPKLVRLCDFPGCEKPHSARGLCGAHVAQDRKGLPLTALRPFGQSLAERYEARVVRQPGCWGWSGNIENGYGRLSAKGFENWAHRISWEIHNGPIPTGMAIDHICHTRQCTRPDHLRVVTYKQNNENLQGARDSNITGIRGVCYRKNRGKWLAHVTHNGKYHHVGLFDTPEAAETAVIAKRNELFTHNTKDRA